MAKRQSAKQHDPAGTRKSSKKFHAIPASVRRLFECLPPRQQVKFRVLSVLAAKVEPEFHVFDEHHLSSDRRILVHRDYVFFAQLVALELVGVEWLSKKKCKRLSSEDALLLALHSFREIWSIPKPLPESSQVLWSADQFFFLSCLNLIGVAVGQAVTNMRDLICQNVEGLERSSYRWGVKDAEDAARGTIHWRRLLRLVANHHVPIRGSHTRLQVLYDILDKAHNHTENQLHLLFTYDGKSSPGPTGLGEPPEGGEIKSGSPEQQPATVDGTSPHNTHPVADPTAAVNLRAEKDDDHQRECAGQSARPVSPADISILTVLEESPGTLSQTAIAAATKDVEPPGRIRKVSARTVSQRMPFLTKEELVYFPFGFKSGAAITNAGRKILDADKSVKR